MRPVALCALLAGTPLVGLLTVALEIVSRPAMSPCGLPPAALPPLVALVAWLGVGAWLDRRLGGRRTALALAAILLALIALLAALMPASVSCDPGEDWLRLALAP